VATAVLTALVTVLGLLPWPRPYLVGTTESSWAIAGVRPAMWGLVIGVAMICVVTGVVVTSRLTGLRAWFPLGVAWLALVLMTAAALVWNALHSAALSAMEFGAIIPIFHWLFTFAPAVLAGALFLRRGRQARYVAAMGTGVVTVPLFHLGALLLTRDAPVEAFVGSLPMTGLLAVAPLVGAVALAGALGGRRHSRLPYPFSR
jgi:hypothetical protein